MTNVQNLLITKYKLETDAFFHAEILVLFRASLVLALSPSTCKDAPKDGMHDGADSSGDGGKRVAKMKRCKRHGHR